MNLLVHNLQITANPIEITVLRVPMSLSYMPLSIPISICTGRSQTEAENPPMSKDLETEAEGFFHVLCFGWVTEVVGESCKNRPQNFPFWGIQIKKSRTNK